MARGWDSKSVEEQIGAAEEEKASRRKPAFTTEERERRSKQAGLLLSRAKIVKDLAAAADPRYRTLLERTLAHLDAQLAAAGDVSQISSS
jgi:hypothetical protein